MTPPEAMASLSEVRRSFPCLFRTAPPQPIDWIDYFMLAYITSDRAVWHMNPASKGHSRRKFIDIDGWSSQPVKMIHVTGLVCKKADIGS